MNECNYETARSLAERHSTQQQTRVVPVARIMSEKRLFELDDLRFRNIRQEYSRVSFLRRGYFLEYLVVNRIVVKRVLLKCYKLRYVDWPNKLVK
jgi:hypothetical protein